MRARLTLAAALVGGALALFPGLAQAGGSGAQKAPLVSVGSLFCTGSGTPGPVANDGFAVLNETGDGHVVAVVSVKDAQPNTTYFVSVVQTPSAAGCNTYPFHFTTNGQGNGTGTFDVSAVSGTTGALVEVSPFGGPLWLSDPVQFR